MQINFSRAEFFMLAALMRADGIIGLDPSRLLPETAAERQALYAAGEASLQTDSSPATTTPRRLVCAPPAAVFIGMQTAPERRRIMKARSTRLSVETLGDRFVPSTVAYGDFNNDGLMDKVAITGQKTLTVSLANPDGSYTLS
jgi:hypothetical protein